MALSAVFTQIYSGAGLNLSVALPYEQSNENVFSNTIPISETNYPVYYAFRYTDLQVFYALASAPLVLKVNSSGSPIITIDLPANIPFTWYYTDGATGFAPNPFNANVTVFYVTNASSTVTPLLTMAALTAAEA